MARDVCVIAKLGCVAEAGEESRLDRVKAILARLIWVLSPSLVLFLTEILFRAVAPVTGTVTFAHAHST